MSPITLKLSHPSTLCTHGADTQVPNVDVSKSEMIPDWSVFFNKLGAGSENPPTSTSLRRYCGTEPILPALPSLAEFAELICRPAHTAVTRRLHHQIIASALELGQAPHGALPPHAAEIALPESAAASAAVSHVDMAATPSHVTLTRFLEAADLPSVPELNQHLPARNLVLAAPGPTDD